ncbi:MAG TPA: hypothetical protein VJP60_02965 [Rhizomicrobium sp.]|nr:hypothetical protein [Rhizomicrobium sp.]
MAERLQGPENFAAAGQALYSFHARDGFIQPLAAHQRLFGGQSSSPEPSSSTRSCMIKAEIDYDWPEKNLCLGARFRDQARGLDCRVNEISSNYHGIRLSACSARIWPKAPNSGTAIFMAATTGRWWDATFSATSRVCFEILFQCAPGTRYPVGLVRPRCGPKVAEKPLFSLDQTGPSGSFPSL